MDFLNLILSVAGLASVLGTAAAVFYAFNARTTIDLRKEEIAALTARNATLDKTVAELTTENEGLKEKIKLLEELKTPPLKDLTKLVLNNHSAVMAAIMALMETLSKSHTEEANK